MAMPFLFFLIKVKNISWKYLCMNNRALCFFCGFTSYTSKITKCTTTLRKKKSKIPSLHYICHCCHCCYPLQPNTHSFSIVIVFFGKRREIIVKACCERYYICSGKFALKILFYKTSQKVYYGRFILKNILYVYFENPIIKNSL